MLSRRLGFRGRTVIHPMRDTASTTVDGKRVDVAMAKTARRVLDLVQSIENR